MFFVGGILPHDVLDLPEAAHALPGVGTRLKSQCQTVASAFSWMVLPLQELLPDDRSWTYRWILCVRIEGELLEGTAAASKCCRELFRQYGGSGGI